jgi:hypothetical protein
MLGGIITPKDPAEAVIDAANPSLYPCSFISGIIKDPIAETVAGPEPEIAAKNIQLTVVTIANPPVIEPIKASDNLSNLFDMPALPINDPASIKNGIAISGKESKDAKAFCAINSIGVLEVSSIVIIVAIPKAIPIGILIVSKINNNANNSNTAN